MESPVAKKATNRWMRCCSGGESFPLRSLMSSDQSTSSTVHVLRIPFLYIS